MNEFNGLKNVLGAEIQRLIVDDSASVWIMGQKFLIALLIGLFIYWVYKKTFRGVLYSLSFNVTLVLLTLVTSLVIMAITSNIVLSLGMVGALSVVRFRSAIKDPIDIAFLFWAISVGIAVGAGFISLAILGSAFIGLVLSQMTRFKELASPYLLILTYASEAESAVLNQLHILPQHRVRSKTASKHDIELILETRLNNQDTSFLSQFQAISGLKNAVLISYNGEYTTS